MTFGNIIAQKSTRIRQEFYRMIAKVISASIDSWFADHKKVVEVSVGSEIIANGDKF